MKKFLLGTTAIVAAAALTSPAVAAEKINLGLGGYMNDWVGYNSNEKDSGLREFRHVNLQTDTEIWVQGSTTLDNGLKFAVRMEIEADGEDTAGTIDESYVDITSPSFGQLKLGYDDNATTLAMVRAPSYGMGIANSYQWIPVGGQGGGANGVGHNERHDIYVSAGSGDEAKITYFTPRFFGFQAGASYSPEVTDRTASGDGPGNSSNKYYLPNAVNGGGVNWAVDLNYANTFGGFGVKTGVGYTRTTAGWRRAGGVDGAAPVFDTPNGVKSVDGYQAGVLLSYAGFEIGAAWETTSINAGPGYNYGAGNSGGEHTAWEAGVGYKSGPWGVNVGYQHAEVRTTAVAGSFNGAAGTNTWDKFNTVALEGIYNLGPGIDVASSIYWKDQDRDSRWSDASFNSGGWAVVVGTKLAF